MACNTCNAVVQASNEQLRASSVKAAHNGLSLSMGPPRQREKSTLYIASPLRISLPQTQERLRLVPTAKQMMSTVDGRTNGFLFKVLILRL